MCLQIGHQPRIHRMECPHHHHVVGLRRRKRRNPRCNQQSLGKTAAAHPLFAAANNEGFRESELFPASHYVNVISVGGAEDDGEPAKGLCPNPKPEHDEDVFSALGVAVPCGNWEDKPPVKSGAGGTCMVPVGMSGCSFAAPVLAATAALFLHYATFAAQYRPEHEKRLQKVFEPQGCVVYSAILAR